MRSTMRWRSSVAERPTIDVATPAGGWGSALAERRRDRSSTAPRQVDARRRSDGPAARHSRRHRHPASHQRRRHRPSRRDHPRHCVRDRRALESLGYELAPSIDERNNTTHRFKWPARYRTPPHSGERCRPTSAPTARPRCGSSTPDAWDVNRGWSAQAQLRLVGDFVVQMSDGPRGARGHRSIPPGIVDEVLAGHCAELASEVARCSMSCSQV